MRFCGHNWPFLNGGSFFKRRVYFPHQKMGNCQAFCKRIWYGSILPGRKIVSQKLWEKQSDFLYRTPIFAAQNSAMSNPQEYQQELKKIQDKDFTHNWVSSSAFLFYLQVACIVAFVLGGCYMLYSKRFDKPAVKVQESTLYTPKYK